MSELSELQVLLIQRACERLVYDFAEYIDTRQYALLDQLFDEQAVYSRPVDPKTVIVGLANIRKVFEGRPTNRVGRHLCSNVRIDVLSPTRAKGSCRVELVGASAEQEPHPQFGLKADQRLVGGYEDEFVKTAAGWRFASRRGYVFAHD